MFGKLARCALLVGLVIGWSPNWSRAAQPIRKEYELLQRVRRQIIEPMLPATGTIIIGRGGCRYLIAAVVTGDEARADDAWKSIEATFAQQAEDGGLRTDEEMWGLSFLVHGVRVENA